MQENEGSDIQKGNFYYFEKTQTCVKHYGIKVTYEISKYNECPLCTALDKIAKFEEEDK